MLEGADSEDRLTFLTPLLFRSGCCEGKLTMGSVLESSLEAGLSHDTFSSRHEVISPKT